MSKFLRWIPALIIMTIIFISSSTSSTSLPNYGFWDTFVKKGGHMTGYGLLAFSFWYGFGFNPGRIWLAGLLALAYAASDEFHQSFTPGRHPSPVDVLLYDGGGAALALFISRLVLRRRTVKTPDPV